MINLKVIRKFKGSDYTIGDLYVNDNWFCNTLEDVVRELPEECPNTPKGISCKCNQKIPGRTAIPAGIYKVVLSYSNRFKKIMPEILNVPHFLGIRIHSGNTQHDTEGCLLVGENKVKGKVINSRNTYNKLMELLQNEDITIEIK